MTRMRALAAIFIAAAIMVPKATAQGSLEPIPLVKDIPPRDGTDVVGVRLGEKREDALAILRKGYPDAKIVEKNYTYRLRDNRSNMVSIMFPNEASLSIETNRLRENVTLYFTSPATGSRVWGIERSVHYKELMDTATTRSAIIKKYGTPTLIERYDHQNRLEITYTYEKRPVKSFGEVDVLKRHFAEPRPDQRNACLNAATSNAYGRDRRYGYSSPTNGVRKPSPGWDVCIGGLSFKFFYGANTQTIYKMEVSANDFDRTLVDAQLLDATLLKLIEAKAGAVRGKTDAPKL